MTRLRFGYLLPALAVIVALAAWTPASAQLQRGARTVVSGGMLPKTDTGKAKRDSVAHAEIMRELNLALNEGFRADSAEITSLRTDDIRRTDSLLAVQLAGGEAAPKAIDTAAMHKRRRGGFMPDSMGLSKVCWISAVLPGYGQIYNKQYWKLPILYGTLGAGLTLFIKENQTYKPLKKQYDAITDYKRTPELDALQTRMIRSNTRRQLYLGLTIASYLYFLGDVAVAYKTNDVSQVKKATTLSCLFPGAGQIYNKSYWKVPFVIGGFAAMIYCIDWNNRGYQRYKQVYGLMVDFKANPEKYDNIPPPLIVPYLSNYTEDYVKNLRNNFRRNRDLCIIITAGLYILQVVDAHVDAHLKDYDISDDLSMSVEPLVDYAYVPRLGGNRPMFGFNLNFKF